MNATRHDGNVKIEVTGAGYRTYVGLEQDISPTTQERGTLDLWLAISFPFVHEHVWVRELRLK